VRYSSRIQAFYVVYPETLHQNNLAMRQQMETLAVWQNEVAKVQQSHSEKFQQTKDLVINVSAIETITVVL